MEHVMANVKLFAVYLNCAERFVGLPARTCFDFHLLNRILMGKKKLVETRCSPCYINGMITHLQEMNANAKLAEIDSIGFGFVKQIPRWAVKQTIMIQLARAYDVETDTLIVDVGDIPVSSELIGRAYFLAEIEGLEQKSDSEVEEGLLMLLDSDLPTLKVDFLELQNSKRRASNCVGK
ncbi:uncharacterized protein DS421_13g411630 [Arachis hypogaea]|nr:uncharacterized protein DS421_13g411630 [Arachis hypogaea]